MFGVIEINQIQSLKYMQTALPTGKPSILEMLPNTLQGFCHTQKHNQEQKDICKDFLLSHF
jgi:hypothetical protein